jgi:isoamylase
MAKRQFTLEAGRRHPLGAHPDEGGVNFAVYAEDASAVELLLFDEHDDPEPVANFQLDPEVHNTFHMWHAYVGGAKPGLHYAYRVDGPQDLHETGRRFNRNKVLIDPYAYGNTANLWNRGDAVGPDDNLATSMRSVVVDSSDYDWEGDLPLNRPMSETVIYEMHVGGFTQSPSAEVEHPGTFAGLIEKIPYLKALGVTAVELLPVFEFDDTETFGVSPVHGGPLVNYWGYSTVGFFAPVAKYCVSPEEGSHLREFRDMVKALHAAGLEVILDVVFNHTNEGNHEGLVFSFKGFANDVYYHLVPDDPQYYMDYSGCGNTINTNHPIVEKFIEDCLEFWVREMHVDGFRFDEGSILSRGEDGEPLRHPPVLWHIELAEPLADTKVIAEAWDAAGLYQVGYFPGERWAEWNGVYRDDIRRFVRGDPGLLSQVASRVAGSADMYQSSGRSPVNSVNFITAHDGFTMMDLVSYNEKHNEANGEGNRDGADDNYSWNCGAEGPTDDPGVNEFRRRQVKNFAAILFLSQGVPMFVMGDEAGRSQGGNNNAYCQDNEISWIDWSPDEADQDLLRFFRSMIAFRKEHPAIHRRRFFTGAVNERGLKDIEWHGCELFSPGWDDPSAQALAFTLGGAGKEADLHVVLNMSSENLDFRLPDVPGRSWHRIIDTAAPSPDDFVDLKKAPAIDGDTYGVTGRSVVVLVSPGGRRRKAK